MVNLRITENRKSVFISLGRKVEPALFKEHANSNWVSGKHPDATYINAIIEDKRQLAVAYIANTELNKEPVDLQQLAAIVKGEIIAANGQKSFLQAITNRANYHYGNNATGSYYKYKNLRNLVEEAWGRDYSFEQITQKEVEKFVLHRRKNDIHQNTIRKDLSFLATVWRQDGKGDNPFETVKIVPVPTTKAKLTPEEIERIEKLSLFGMAELAKDMFLFSFYAQGMRFENVCLMPKHCLKDGYILYQMNKGKKHRQLQAHSRLTAIVKKYQGGKGLYLFPLIKTIPKTVWAKRDIVGSANTEINKFLKVVASAAGITKNLTFHLARHAFSYQALGKGVTYSELKDALGHSNYATTQAYLDSLSDDHINKAVSKLYGD